MSLTCPHCGSEHGFMVFERVHRYLLFDQKGKPNYATEDVTENRGTRAYCIDCGKTIPRKIMAAEIGGEEWSD